MNIALIGYGRMGKTIERIARDRGHAIVYINNGGILDIEQVKLADVAIEFTQPDAAAENITKLLTAGIPVVSGTTGWLEAKNMVDQVAFAQEIGFVYASNFSLGVNLFFAFNEKLAKMMNLKVVESPNDKNDQSKPTKIDPKYVGKKMSRNEPCFCGSGKKYKRCCGAL